KTTRSRRQPLQLTHIYPVSQQTTATTDHPLLHNKTNPSIGLFYPTCLKQPEPTTSPNRNLFLCLPNNTVEATTNHLILRNENFTELSPTSQRQPNQPQHLTDIYPFSSDQQQIVDARGPNRTKIVIEGLSRGFRYAFTVQAYNEHGRSNHSLPAASVHMLDLSEGVASSSMDSSQSRMPRLILLLLSLTGTALLIVNVSIIVCFLRRRAQRRNLSDSSSKFTLSTLPSSKSTFDVYAPAATPPAPHVDHLPLTAAGTISPPDYQIRARDRANPPPSPSRWSATRRTTRARLPACPSPQRRAPAPHVTPPLASSSPRAKSASPLLNGGIRGPGDAFRPEEKSGSFAHKAIYCKTPQLSPQLGRSMTLDRQPGGLQVPSKPDVCPRSSNSREPLLQQSPYPEEDRVSLLSHHSADSYSICRGRNSPKASSYRSPAKPTTQVIYHGQPHLQKHLEQQQYSQDAPCNCRQDPQPPQNPCVQASASFTDLDPLRQAPHHSGCCCATCRQPLASSGLEDLPGRFSASGPRRSCLKSSHLSSLQRSHSDRAYTYSRPRSADPRDIELQNTCTLCTTHDPQGYQGVGPAYGRAQEYPMYYGKPQDAPEESLHGDLHAGYRTFYRESKWSSATPDVCKVEHASTKRVGWKEELLESPRPGQDDGRTSVTKEMDIHA
ncbi:hypothetical protein C7M84_018072, partial [Penaeus vannamei]